ncbi:MAG: glycosyltransferase [Ignavibacteriaceae bacterium]
MKICFATYPAVALTGGGPFIKIKEIKYNLELLGHKVDFFDMWNSDQKLAEYDIVHLVGANFAVFGLARTLKEKKINYVVEPVFFSNHTYKFIKNINSLEKFTRKISRGIWFDYGIIKDICNWSEMVLPNTFSESEIKMNQNIHLVNALDNDDPLLASAYAACDTFVLPSQFETPGIAALEAGLAGAKIVITPFGGTREYFTDMAEYPDINSIDSIKNSIEKSLNKPKDEKLKDHIKNNFLWNKIARDTSDVYVKVAEKIKSK